MNLTTGPFFQTNHSIPWQLYDGQPLKSSQSGEIGSSLILQIGENIYFVILVTQKWQETLEKV